MMQIVFLTLSSIVAFISPIVYCIAILKGRVKPHRTTRLVFLVISSLTVIALLAQNNTVAIWLAAISALQSVIIFVLSLKFGMGGWAKSDMICMTIATIGIILWQITNNPVIGLYFAIGADFAGTIPTLIKTYKFPETEIWTFYTLDVIASFLSLIAIQNWTLADISYPLYIMLINLLMVSLVLRHTITKKLKLNPCF